MASWSMSIAESTACSASSEYGGCRSLKGSRLRLGGAIENSTDELDIFPGGAFPRWIAKQRRRVIRDDQRHTMEPVQLATEFSEHQLRLQQSLGSECSKSKDCFWPDQLKLTKEIRAAGGYFVRHRIAIARRPMLEDVTDENVLASQIHRRENLCEQLAGRADERQSGFIFGLPW